MKSYKVLVLDVNAPGIGAAIYARCGDVSTRRIAARVAYGVEPIYISENAVIEARARLPDGNTCDFDCAAENGAFLMEIPSSALQHPGKAILQAKIMNGESVLITPKIVMFIT